MFVKRTENSLFSKWWIGIDKTILFTVLGLIAFGIFMVYSTGPIAAKRSGLSELFFIGKLVYYLPVGIFFLLFISCIKIRFLRIGALLAFPILLLTNISTVFFSQVKGASRWIVLFGGFKVQPSEFMKPIFAIVVAMILSRIKDLHKEDGLKNIWENKRERNYIILLGSIATLIFGILLGLQSDFGMTVTYAAILMGEIFVAGLSWFWISIFIAIGGSAALCILTFVPHVVNRLKSFSEGSYQLKNSIDAINKSNILFGGFGNNIKTRIPDVHTDFIFSAIVEDWGPIMATLLIVTFFILIFHIFEKVKNSDNDFVLCSVVGIVTYFTFQVIINTSTAIGLFPTKGTTLPFISYGGSAFISYCVAFGIVLSLLQERNLRE